MHRAEDHLAVAQQVGIAGIGSERVGTTQQQGLNSRGFKGCILPDQEKRIQRFHELLNDYVAGKGPVQPA